MKNSNQSSPTSKKSQTIHSHELYLVTSWPANFEEKKKLRAADVCTAIQDILPSRAAAAARDPRHPKERLPRGYRIFIVGACVRVSRRSDSRTRGQGKRVKAVWGRMMYPCRLPRVRSRPGRWDNFISPDLGSDKKIVRRIFISAHFLFTKRLDSLNERFYFYDGCKDDLLSVMSIICLLSAYRLFASDDTFFASMKSCCLFEAHIAWNWVDWWIIKI